MRTRTCHQKANRTRTSRTRSAAFGAQRGIAMLLVLISLMMATVLATSYLSSRDNSAIIGQNAVSAASARWAAESGIDFGAAILQTEKSWRTAHSGGRLVSNYPLAGSIVNIDLLDMETNQPPTAATENVKMTVSATVDGLLQTAVAMAHVPATTSPVVDVDLSEFAVFAATRLDMHGQSTLARWPKAPLAALGDRIAIGTRSTGASSIALSDDAAAVDTTVYAGPGASALLVAVAKGQSPEQVVLPDPIPLPAAPASGVTPGSGYSDITQNGGTATVNANAHYNTLEVRSTGTRTLRGAITVIVDDDVRIRENSKVIIDGNVKLVVFGDLQLDAGAIELRPGAKLTAYVRGNSGTALEIKDGYVGDLRANGVRDATGASPYMDPERVIIYSVAGGNGEWRIRDNSVVKGSLYAPNSSNVTIQNQSAVYGRVAAANLTMSDSAAVFYDPSLNESAGFTKTDSALYAGNGRLKVEFANIVSLDTGVIQAAADATGMLIKTVFGLLTPTGYTAPGAAAVAPTDPTPRPVEIDFRIVSVGDALKTWE